MKEIIFAEKIILMLLLIIILFSAIALAENDPGHDTLYIEEQGDSELNGSLNVTGNASIEEVIFSGVALDLRGDDEQTGSNNRIVGINGAGMAIQSTGNIYINTLSGTSSTVNLGDGGGDSVNINITGALFFGTGGRLAASSGSLASSDLYWGDKLICNASESNCGWVTSATGGGDVTGVYGDNIYIYNGTGSGEITLVLNETKLNETINARATALGDGNNYTTSIGFSGTSTKTLHLEMVGMANLTAEFTDIDTDTGNCSIDQSCLNILYDTNATDFYSNSNPLNYLNSTTAGVLYYSIDNPNNYASGTSNLTLAQVVSGVGNWTADKASYTLLTYTQSLGNWSLDKASYTLLTYTQSLGNWSGDKSLYTLKTYVDSIGNWSSDKPSYVSQTYGNATYSLLTVFNQLAGNVSSIGNWSADKSLIQANITNVNATANLKALPGTCGAGEFVQNTTTAGVECAAPTEGGTITSITFNTSGLLGGEITSSGSVDLNYTYLNLLYNDTDTWWSITGSAYLYNNSNILTINETKLNATIEARSSTSGGGWTDLGTTINLSTPTDNVSANTLFIDNTNGKIGVGLNSPLALLHIQSSSIANQFRISYDDSNYGNISVNSGGNLTIRATGHVIIDLS